MKILVCNEVCKLRFALGQHYDRTESYFLSVVLCNHLSKLVIKLWFQFTHIKPMFAIYC